MISPNQCRAARGMLKWTQPKLAAQSGVGLSTINRYENETRPPRETAVMRLRLALEEAGIEFLAGNDSLGEGVRMKNSGNGA